MPDHLTWFSCAFNRFDGYGKLCADKMYDVLVAHSPGTTAYKFGAEARFDMANPLRACYGPDAFCQFGRKDLSRWKIGADEQANRCQKPVQMMRCVVRLSSCAARCP